MGMSKGGGGGFQQVATKTPGQSAFIDQILALAAPNQQQAAEGFAQFLPGGGGGQPIIDAANKNFQQSTLPQIFNSVGRDAKTSSALNQALAAGASNLNTDIASQMAQMQLQAASGLGQLGLGQGQQGLTSQFDQVQKGGGGGGFLGGILKAAKPIIGGGIGNAVIGPGFNAVSKLFHKG